MQTGIFYDGIELADEEIGKVKNAINAGYTHVDLERTDKKDRYRIKVNLTVYTHIIEKL